MNNVIKKTNKILNHFKDHSFAIDYSDYWAERDTMYKNIAQEFDKTFLFWRQDNFYLYKQRYDKLINISDYQNKKRDYLNFLIQDLDLPSSTIQNLDFFRYMWAPESSIITPNYSDKSTIYTFFSWRKIQNKSLKNFLYTLNSNCSFTSTLEKLISYQMCKLNVIPWKKNFIWKYELFLSQQKEWKFFNKLFKLFVDETLYDKIDFKKLQEREISDKSVLNVLSTRKQYQDEYWKKLPSIFSEEWFKIILHDDKSNFVYFMESYFWEKYNLLNSKFYELYSNALWKNISSKEEFEYINKILQFSYTLRYWLYLYLKTYNFQSWDRNLYNLFNTNTDIVTAIFKDDMTFKVTELDNLFKLTKELSVFIVRDILWFDKDSKFAKLLFSKEFLKEHFDSVAKKDLDFDNFNLKSHIENILNYFWKWQNKNDLWVDYNVEDKLLDSIKYDVYFQVLNTPFYPQADISTQSYAWKTKNTNFFNMKSKDWKEEFVFDINIKYWIDYFDVLNKELLNKYYNRTYYEINHTLEYLFTTYHWNFEVLSELIWELFHIYENNEYFNKNHSIYFVDNWWISFQLWEEIFRNNKIFNWKEENLYLSIFNNTLWSWLVENLTEIEDDFTYLYDRKDNSIENKKRRHILRWNSKFWFSSIVDFDKYYLSLIERQEILKYKTNSLYLHRFHVAWIKKLDSIKLNKFKKLFAKDDWTIFDLTDWLKEVINIRHKFFWEIIDQRIENLRKQLSDLEIWFVWLHREQEKENKVLFLFDDSNINLNSSYICEDQWSFQQLFNKNCKFLFSKYVYSWFAYNWSKSFDWETTTWNFLWEVKFYESDKDWRIYKTFESQRLSYIWKKEREEAMNASWLQDYVNYVHKHVNEKDIRNYYLKWYAWNKFELFEILYFFSTNRYFKETWYDNSLTTLIKLIEKSIFFDEHKNRYDELRYKFKKRYKWIEIYESYQDIFENLFTKFNKEKEQFYKETIKKYFLRENITYKNDTELQREYLKFKRYLSDQSYKLLWYFWLEDQIIDVLDNLRKNKWKWRETYYFITHNTLNTWNWYYLSEDDYLDLIDLNEYDQILNQKNQSDYIHQSIFDWRLRKYTEWTNVVFIRLWSWDEQFISKDFDWIIIYYWTEKEFIYEKQKDNINWIIFHDREIWLNRAFKKVLKSKRYRIDWLRWFQYQEYYLLANILLNNLNNWDNTKLWKFKFIHISNKWMFSYKDFFNWLKINDLDIQETFNLNDSLNKLKNENKEIMNLRINNNIIYWIIWDVIDEFINKVEDITVNWLNSFAWEDDLNEFKKYNSINFQEEFSIFVNNINNLYQLKSLNEKDKKDEQ